MSIDKTIIVVSLIACVQIFAADLQIPATVPVDDSHMDSDKDVNVPHDKQQAVVALFEVAARKNDVKKFDAATTALAAFPGHIRLTEFFPGTEDDIGEALADRVAQMSQGNPRSVLNLAYQLHKIELNEPARQRILAEFLALAQMHHDDRALATVIKLIPSEVSSPHLAFNLACYSALKKDRAAMLTYVKLSLALGKTSELFRTDPDFAAYKKDKEFIAILDADDAQTQLLTDLGQSIDSGDLEQYKRLRQETERRGISLSSHKMLKHVIREGSTPIFEHEYAIVKRLEPYERPDDTELLLEAIEHRRHEIACILLKHGVIDITLLNGLYWTIAMGKAIRDDDAKTVQALIKGGLDFDQRRKFSLDALFRSRNTITEDISRGFGEALHADAVDVVESIIRRASGVHRLQREVYLKTLQYFLYQGNRPSRRMIATLLKTGLSFDDLRSYEEDQSLLTKAIVDHEAEFIDYLLDEMNVPLSHDMQEMRAAVVRGDAPLLDRLIRHQRRLHPNWTFADIAFWNKLETLSNKPDSGRGALVKSLFKSSQFDVIKVFTTSVVSAEDKFARNILLALSVASARVDAMQYFLKQGADANVLLQRDGKKFPAIVVALANCDYEIAEILLNHGARIDSVDSRGDTLLHQVAFCEQAPAKLSLIDRLVASRAIDINAKNTHGLAALDYAIIKDDTEAVRTLLARGAEPGLLRVQNSPPAKH